MHTVTTSILVRWSKAMPVVVLAFVLAAAPARAQSTRPAKNLTTAQLIDQLVDVNSDDLETTTRYGPIGQPNALVRDGATAINQDADQGLEAMNELIRRGVESLPVLIKHLPDGRKSKAIAVGLAATEFSSEFDTNPHGESAVPKDVDRLGEDVDRANQIFGDKPRGDYTVSVGDICFTLIGRIVNRRYEAVHYVPEGVAIVNSPVLWPPLARAVEARWGQLTEARHRQSLVADIEHPDDDARDFLAVSALERYYPDAVPSTIHDRLSQPTYDFRMVAFFADERLYPAADLEASRRAADDFIKTHGAAYRDGLVLDLWRDRRLKAGNKDDDGFTVNVPPLALLAQLVAHFDAGSPPIVESNEGEKTGEFIGSLRGLESARLDGVVLEKFKQICNRHSDVWGEDDWIAEGCVRDLAHKGHDAELKAFCVRRQKECSADSFGPEETRELLDLIDSKNANPN